ncbi:MAG: twin-arginine translocation signal domain-containing protein [Proteobacteria bacterium]|nr:twin-arginine translocation signal domain-containing protein [Pseudomonadota bacterium]MBI3497537.1 twin-arginine translocation signal domain-containing protein [Pseudomonadota bacterium]
MSWNTLSRRRFLQTGTAAGALAGLSPNTNALAQSTKVLRVRAYGNPGILDPANRLGAIEDDIMRCLCGGLITVKAGDEWGWEKEYATEIVQESPTHIRFQLKPGIAWSNGFGEVTAEDVKFSYERIANPDMKAAYRVDWEKLDKVEVTGTHSGVIVMKEPFMPLWESTLPSGSGVILCKKAVEKLDGQRITTSVPAVSGPYRIQKFETRRIVILERNPLWTGPKPVFDEIHYISIVDANAAEVAHQAGELDFTPQLPASAVPRLKAKPPTGSTLIVKPSLAFWWLGMQSEDGIFKDIRVRKAVQLAVDVDSVLEGAFFGAVTRATGVIAPGLIGHRPRNLVEKPDLAKAKQLLAEAGYPNGFKTDIGVRNSAEFISAAQVVAASLAQIGITAVVTPFDAGAQKALASDKSGGWKKMALHIVRFSMQPDPSWATAWYVTSQIGEWNWERLSSKEFDDLHVAALSEQDRAKRDRMYQRMQTLMEESGSYVFLTHGVSAALCRNGIKPALSPDGQRVLFSKFGLA